MIILAIDTSCDETSAAVTQGTTVLSNVIWSQSSAHAEFGGVMPSLAQRMHGERINFVVQRAITKSQVPITKIEAVAATSGPGLAIALGVGISKAKEMATELKVPLLGINHIEGHLLSPLALANHNYQLPITNQFSISKLQNSKNIDFPALGLVVSGGHTELVYIEKIGRYKILAQTQDDALGEALDKAARMLGLGYPGGAILEKFAKEGNPKIYPLPLPMARHQEKHEFSYSGLKTALLRLIATEGQASLNRQNICDLAATFQNRAFQHLTRVIKNTLLSSTSPLSPACRQAGFPSPQSKRGAGERFDLLVGGGVAANMKLRYELRVMGRELGLKVHFPYSMKLVGDNAAMVGIAAHFQITNHKPQIPIDQIDRRARWSVEEIS